MGTLIVVDDNAPVPRTMSAVVLDAESGDERANRTSHNGKRRPHVVGSLQANRHNHQIQLSIFPARALLLPIVTEDDADEPAPPPLTTPPAMPRILYVRNFPVHTRARDLAYEFER